MHAGEYDQSVGARLRKYKMLVPPGKHETRALYQVAEFRSHDIVYRALCPWQPGAFPLYLDFESGLESYNRMRQSLTLPQNINKNKR